MRQREPALPFGAQRIARAQAQRTFDHRHPTVGAVFLLLLSEGQRVLIGNQVLGVDITIYGLLLVLFIIYRPKGILGTALQKVARARV